MRIKFNIPRSSRESVVAFVEALLRSYPGDSFTFASDPLSVEGIVANVYDRYGRTHPWAMFNTDLRSISSTSMAPNDAYWDARGAMDALPRSQASTLLLL